MDSIEVLMRQYAVKMMRSLKIETSRWRNATEAVVRWSVGKAQTQHVRGLHLHSRRS